MPRHRWQRPDPELKEKSEKLIVDLFELYRKEARVLRALAYYHLMDLFGKAAFVTENDPIGVYQGPEYNREQLFSFIESELLLFCLFTFIISVKERSILK